MSLAQTGAPPRIAEPPETGMVVALARLVQLAGGQRGPLALTVLVGVLHHSAGIALATAGAYVVGVAVGGGAASALAPLLWALGGLMAARAALAWLDMWLIHDIAYRVLAEIRAALYDALERLAPGGLLQRRSGDVVAAAMADINALELFYAHILTAALVALLVPLAALAALAALHPLLALALLPALLLAATVPAWLYRRAAAQGEIVRAQLGSVNADVVDSVQGLREVVLFGHGERQLARIERTDAALLAAQRRYGRRAGLERAATGALTALGMLAVLATAAWLAGSGRLAAPLLPAAAVLAASVFAPVVGMAQTLGSLGMVLAAARRVFALLDAPPPVVETAGTSPPALIAPRVAFEQVGFCYSPALPPALHGVSFTVEPGETVALVGRSGAGKTTCAHLLLRLWDAAAGRVTVGGYDLRALPLATLRDLVTLVPQDVYLFHASVQDNLRLGRPDATDAEIQAAARVALAHDFITALPRGYDTVTGERGVQLSGGQRQRLAIARALLKDTPILVLDEAVSNLDAENERLIQAALAQLRAGRTTLVVAHRLSTIRSADRIVVLERGRVAEIGTHDALLARQGSYARLIAAQRDGILTSSATPGTDSQS